MAQLIAMATQMKMRIGCGIFGGETAPEMEDVSSIVDAEPCGEV